MSRNKNDVNKLFEFYCEVKRSGTAASNSENNAADTNRHINGALNNNSKPVIIESFPASYRDSAAILNFAFPCDTDESNGVKPYSFVVTTDDAIWRYGFCRHDARTQTAMVLITHLPWHDTFLKLMQVLATLQRSDKVELKRFLIEMYNCGVPAPGSQLKVQYNKDETFVFDQPLVYQLPSIPRNHNLNLYYNFVESKHMIAVFAAMLAERRIIFKSRCLDRLSSCIQAAHAFLYPMVWQHIYIPILPMQLKEYVSAPMPYLIGVPQAVFKTLHAEEMGDVVVLDCDNKVFMSPFDDLSDMPNVVVQEMKKQFRKTQEHTGDGVSRIFLRALVQFLCGYRDAVEFREPNRTFNFDKFIESRPTYLRSFIAKMSELQIFRQFIDERIEKLNKGLEISDEFEMETVCYADRLQRSSFFKNVKEKTNPAVKSAVKSVKEGSRGMKTAYKDLKSKFREHTPPHSSRKIGAGRHSAPSSPIFSKRIGGSVPTAGGFQYATPEELIGASQHVLRSGTSPAIPLAMSNSSSNIQSNNYRNYHLASSPTISPASSLGSSEMNLSQELQSHPLFKPVVDRSSLRSLQTQHLPVPNLNTQSNMSGSMHSLPPPSTKSTHLAKADKDIVDEHEQQQHNDLISLDDSQNNSFDLEDFDPLNQNARPLPTLAGSQKLTHKSTTLPAGTNPATAFISAAISNPVYTYYTPQHMPTMLPPTEKPPPIPTSLPPDDDFEWLAKYGLDQFTLTKPATNSTPTANGGTNGMSNWTTFD